jgi:hypothetical protein
MRQGKCTGIADSGHVQFGKFDSGDCKSGCLSKCLKIASQEPPLVSPPTQGVCPAHVCVVEVFTANLLSLLCVKMFVFRMHTKPSSTLQPVNNRVVLSENSHC